LSQLGRVLILGANGQVGRELQRTFCDAGELIAFDRRHADLGNPNQLREAVCSAAPDLILNAAAYTAVDRAESDRDAAFAINAEAPRILAEEALRRDIPLIHYSTDYVFDGGKDSPWLETDPTGPLNVYGASKLAGEQAIASTGCLHIIFRTSWVYGPHGKNFVLTMLRLAAERERLTIVDDQSGAPTTSIAIADATRTVLDEILSSGHARRSAQDWSGVYHLTCAGATTWCRFAKEIFARAGSLIIRAPEVVPIASKDYPTPAIRPRNSILSNHKLIARFGVQMPTWEDALNAALAELRAA
jgi:dTDP-4-dehydrorhamnose reductase